MGSNPETGKVFSTQISVLMVDIFPNTLTFLLNLPSVLFSPGYIYSVQVSRQLLASRLQLVWFLEET